jgi:hypothetical protein
MEYTTFIPTHVFDTIKEMWEDLDNFNNWLDKDEIICQRWIENVKNIIKLDNGYILVIWNQTMQGGHNTSSIYKGILE